MRTVAETVGIIADTLEQWGYDIELRHYAASVHVVFRNGGCTGRIMVYHNTGKVGYGQIKSRNPEEAPTIYRTVSRAVA